MLNLHHSNFNLEIDNHRFIQNLTHNGVNLLAKQPLPLFAIQFRDSQGDFLRTSASDAKNSTLASNNNFHTFTYNDFEKFDITVTVTLEITALMNWRIYVENRTDYILEWIDFPQICVPNNLIGNGGDFKILWPFNEGVEIENIALREESGFAYIEPSYPSRGTAGLFPAIVESQFVAYYNGTSGLYIGAHDNNGNVKSVEVFRLSSELKLQFRIYTGGNFGDDYNMDYNMVIGVFEGDWYDGAAIYRNWFEENHKDEFIKLAENKNLPQWYEDSPVIVAYPVRGVHDTDVMSPNKLYPYTSGMKHIHQFAEKLDSRIMALLMHWEGTAPWAPPYVWPPYGSEESFKKYGKQLHDAGHLFGVYCSGLGWTDHSGLTFYTTTAQYNREHLEKHMCTSPTGEVKDSNICRGIRYGYDLCCAEEFTKNTLSKEVEGMVSGGVDYIQILDQNHGGLSPMCYSKEHSHPPVPGKWQTEHVKSLLDTFKEISKKQGRNILFGCESAAAESFIPNMMFNDNRYNLNFTVGRPVPLYAYLYHSYINNFMGNQVSTHGMFDHDAQPENLLYRIAYSFTAGDMATIVINQDGDILYNWGDTFSSTLPNADEVLTLIKNTNQWRTSIGKKYLYSGQMVKPFKINDCGQHTFHLITGRTYTCDKILTSCWQAYDGTLGQVMTNFTNKDIECQIALGEHEFYLYNSIQGAPKKISGKQRLKIPALSAIMVMQG